MKPNEKIREIYEGLVTKAKLMARNGSIDNLALRVLAIEIYLDEQHKEDESA